MMENHITFHIFTKHRNLINGNQITFPIHNPWQTNMAYDLLIRRLVPHPPFYVYYISPYILPFRAIESPYPFVQTTRQSYTHCRPLCAEADPEAVIRYFRTYRRCHGDILAEFVAHHGKLWDEANRYGMKAYEGIVRLVDLFPEEWRGWITTTAKLHISP